MVIACTWWTEDGTLVDMATQASAALMPRAEDGSNRFLPRGPDDANVNAAKCAWLAACESGMTVRATSEATGIHAWTAYRWEASDPEFAEAWELARQSAGHEIEGAMVRRATTRDDMPAYLSGVTYLRRLWPERYSPERQAQVQVNIVVQAAAVRQAMRDVTPSLRAPTTIDVPALPAPSPQP